MTTLTAEDPLPATGQMMDAIALVQALCWLLRRGRGHVNALQSYEKPVQRILTKCMQAKTGGLFARK